MAYNFSPDGWGVSELRNRKHPPSLKRLHEIYNERRAYLLKNHPDKVQNYPEFDRWNKIEETSFINNPSVEEEINTSDVFDTVGETSVLSETTPLLPSSVGAVTASTGLSTGTQLAIAAGIVTAGVGAKIGSALQEDNSSEHKNPTITLPGQKYLGPGNTVGKQSDPEPVNQADYIAREHDLDYSKAKTPQDIKNADNAAVAEFANKALEGDWRSAIGAAGLQVKQIAEKVAGKVIYPVLGK